MYYHGESINVNVQATNNSNKTVKKIRISGKLIEKNLINYQRIYLFCLNYDIKRRAGMSCNITNTLCSTYDSGKKLIYIAKNAIKITKKLNLLNKKYFF